jgi:hypothetical protein
MAQLRQRVKRILVIPMFLMLIPSADASSPTDGPSLVQLSADPYTNPTSQHQTEVEPDTFAYGSTIVAAFQAGRFNGIGRGLQKY